MAKFNRLHDIEITERSLVDYPANLRRFLLVKRDNMPDQLDLINKRGLEGEAKEAALRMLDEAMKMIGSLVDQLKDRPEGDGVGTYDLSEAMQGIATMIFALQKSVPVADPETAGNLDVITEAAERLKSVADVTKSGGEISQENLRELSAIKNLLAGSTTGKEDQPVTKKAEPTVAKNQIDLEKIPEDQREVIAGMMADVAKRKEEDAKAAEIAKADEAKQAEAAEAAKLAEDATKDELSKRDEELAKRDEELAELRKSLTEEKDIRLLSEAVEEVKKSYSEIPGDPSKLAQVFKTLADKAPAELVILKEILSAASETIGKSAAFTEIGSGSGEPEPDSAEGRANKMAEDMVSKGIAKSMSAARAQVWEGNPKLYEDYLAECQKGMN